MHRQSLLDCLTLGSFKPRVIIIGGGIHGAAALRVCALNQIPALLLERSDYSAETSSRSSKMAHGGLRYLETFDFKQVREGIRARDLLISDAAHLCHPQRFLIPIKSGEWWQRLKLSAGLTFYDFICSHPEWRHRWIQRDDLNTVAFNSSTAGLSGCFEYYDGLMNDTRIAIETITDACARGANSLNYAEVTAIAQHEASVAVEFSDHRTNLKYQIECECVINCAGPWVAKLGCRELAPLQARLRYSRGIHLVFKRQWQDPALFLPLREKSRYYWVWPHAAGTMAGTTERDVDQVEFDPLPYRDEVDEVLQRLAHDLPTLGLNRDSLLYAFAGVRTLPIRHKGGASALVSRRHIWVESGRIFSLLGGKWTTANFTAFEGVKRCAKILNFNSELQRLDGVRLPGCASVSELSRLERELVSSGLTHNHAGRIVARYGIKADRFLENSEFRQELANSLLRGELKIACELEHAQTVDDILRRRLDRELMPGHGLDQLNAVAEYLKAHGASSEALSSQCQTYRDRVARVYEIIGKDSKNEA